MLYGIIFQVQYNIDSFENAELRCQTLGGHLTSIHSDEENNFVAGEGKTICIILFLMQIWHQCMQVRLAYHLVETLIPILVRIIQAMTVNGNGRMDQRITIQIGHTVNRTVTKTMNGVFRCSPIQFVPSQRHYIATNGMI